MATVSISYDGSAQALATGTLDSLAANTWWQSAAIDNTATPLSSTASDTSLDCLVQCKILFGAVTPAADKAVYVYVYGSADGGTTYPDAITGSASTFTANSPTQLKLLGTLFTPSGSATYTSEPFSVASLFGGAMPPKWGVAVWNNAGVSASTGSAIKFQAIKQSVV